MITNSLRLFQLPLAVQRHLQNGELSPGHAVALLVTPNRELQEELARLAIAEGLSVRALEETVRSRGSGFGIGDTPSPAPEASSPSGRPNQGSGLRPPGVLELEELLALHLNTRVTVDMRAKRGRVVVEFATLEDLERIYRLMIGEPSS